jgi:hypothetical protein
MHSTNLFKFSAGHECVTVLCATNAVRGHGSLELAVHLFVSEGSFEVARFCGLTTRAWLVQRQSRQRMCLL